MPTIRSVILVPLAAVLALAVAGTASASVPVARLTAKVSPHGRRLTPGTPIAFALDTHFASEPPGGRFVLRRLDYLLPRGTAVNGRFFPSCSVRMLQRARGRLRACPKGSRIGRGIVTGLAVELGFTSRARLTLFNGPGGRSVTMNVTAETPALVNVVVSAPFRMLRGGGARRLTIFVPSALTRVLEGDIATSRVRLAVGATRVVHGVKRGYVEAGRCPRSGKARIHGKFAFERGATASAGARFACD